MQLEEAVQQEEVLDGALKENCGNELEDVQEDVLEEVLEEAVKEVIEDVLEEAHLEIV